MGTSLTEASRCAGKTPTLVRGAFGTDSVIGREDVELVGGLRLTGSLRMKMMLWIHRDAYACAECSPKSLLSKGGELGPQRLELEHQRPWSDAA